MPTLSPIRGRRVLARTYYKNMRLRHVGGSSLSEFNIAYLQVKLKCSKCYNVMESAIWCYCSEHVVYLLHIIRAIA